MIHGCYHFLYWGQKHQADFTEGVLLNGIYSQAHFDYLSQVFEGGIFAYFMNQSFRRTHAHISGCIKVMQRIEEVIL